MLKFIVSVFLLASMSHKKEVLLVGDSLAEGLYPHLRSIGTQYHITGMYKRGSTVPYWNSNRVFLSALKDKKWDIVLVSLGTNDLKTKPKTMKKYYQFNDRLAALQTNVYWIIPPVMPFRNELMEEWIENPLPPIQKIDCPETYQRAEDMIHLTPKGYKDWSICVLDSLPW